MTDAHLIYLVGFGLGKKGAGALAAGRPGRQPVLRLNSNNVTCCSRDGNLGEPDSGYVAGVVDDADWRKTMKKLLIAVAALCVATAIPAAQATSPKREMRGVWISTHISLDWPNRTQTPAQQRAALLGILDHNKATGMNAA